jgi:hypothetical protein
VSRSCSRPPGARRWCWPTASITRPEQYAYHAFLATTDREEVQALTCHYPQRWHIEEFFHFDQALGWQRAGTLNLHIRYGQMSLALVAQVTLHQLRQRLGEPFCHWEATHRVNSSAVPAKSPCPPCDPPQQTKRSITSKNFLKDCVSQPSVRHVRVDAVYQGSIDALQPRRLLRNWGASGLIRASWGLTECLLNEGAWG